MAGYIKLHRQLLDSVYFTNPNYLKVWIWMLLKANFKQRVISMKVGKGYTDVILQRGEFIFGRSKAEEELGMDGSMIYRVIKSFQQFESIVVKSNNQYSVITICNFDSYNVEENQDEQQANSRRTAGEQLANTDNKDKKVNKVKNLSIEDSLVGLPSATQPEGVVSYEKRCQRFIEQFNSIKVVGGKKSKYQVTSAIRQKLKLRLNSYKPNQILDVLTLAMKDKKHIENNFVYITPEFILRENIIERYLNSPADQPSPEEVYTGPKQSINHQQYEKK